MQSFDLLGRYSLGDWSDSNSNGRGLREFVRSLNQTFLDRWVRS